MNDVAVVVGSCDKYSFTWPPLCHGLNKYWSDPPWPIHIVTNHLDAPCGQTLKIGDDPGWTGTARIALQTINKPVVLWLADDIWLTAPPKMQNLIDWADIILRGEADYIRLNEGRDKGDGTFSGDPRLFIVSARYEYRASLQPALWSTSKFLELLGADRDSAWSFEIESSKLAWSNDGRFLAAKDSLTLRWPNFADPDWKNCQTPITRGHWTGAAKEYAKREGITIDWRSNPYGW